MLSLSSELARNVLDAAPDAMVIIDRAGKIRFANRQAAAVFGYTHDELVGQPIELLMPAQFRGVHVGHRDDYMQQPRVRPMGGGLDLLGRRRDGTEFPVEISLSPIGSVDEALVAAAIRDVTERKRGEAELIVARLTAERAREAADRAREAADRANTGKSRFLATASHDLRQPLQSLSLLNGVLRRSVTDADATEALSQQEQAIGAMARLLNALLDISKLESGAVRAQPSDFVVGTLFQELRREFSGLAASKGLTLEADDDGSVARSDRALVEQVLKNLLSNAIKYTPAGGVTLKCRAQGPAQVRIEVGDTGVGIPADQLPLIYDEFYQVGVPAHAARNGYGLGLSIVQRLVALLGARLDVSSRVGVGSVFALLVPVGRMVVGAAATSAETVCPRPVPAQIHVLLVEDDPSVRSATRLLLRSEGYVVSAVASVAEALQQLAEMPRIDLLLTDYHLSPEETGMQLVARVRERLGCEVPAVLITGDTSSAMRELRATPKLRIASKPLKAETLLGTIRELLKD
ncbi:MAG: PAS domain S-box protein [Proteobacteria bacterium]|nr:PAS domain S-box protein [Pseudomonadota bacterium]